jgi:hypothetical protein
MAHPPPPGRDGDGRTRVRYNRQLLLREPKRSQVLALQEVQQYGADSFGDPEYVSLYGLNTHGLVRTRRPDPRPHRGRVHSRPPR